MIKIKLSSSSISNKSLKYFNQAIIRNETSNFGENVEVFKAQLENFLTNNYSVALLNSATSALHLALVNLGIKSEDEVICQSFTFAASAFPILYQNAKPIFVDSELDTWNICPNTLELAINDRIQKGKKPKAIIIVHSYGMPAKMDEIIEISKRHAIPIIEDAAEALGSQYKKRKCGTFGEFGIISFNGNKIITTSGGGALICKQKEDLEKINFLANQAKDQAPHYEHSALGYNYSMGNILASIGRAQMEVLSENIKRRRRINKFYTKLFKNIEGVKLFIEPHKDFYSNHWLSCILINPILSSFTREDLRLAFLKENIESRPLWKPLHLQPIFKDSGFYGTTISENLFKNGLCLPSGSNLEQKDLDRISRVVERLLNKG